MSKKKVAILTLHRAVNYGAVLQAYAFQRKLFALGIDNEILDYRNELIEKYYFSVLANKGSLKAKIISVITFNRQKKRNKQFKKFWEENLILSKEYYNKNNISESKLYFDNFIVGSDQVWNLPCISYDSTYFLDFVEDSKQKHSYAISLGKYQECKEDYNDYYKFIEEFSNISLRENEGKQFLSNNIKSNINVHIDPTFLLEDSEWKSFLEEPSISNYILVYSVNLTSTVLDIGRQMAKRENKNLVIINLRNKKLILEAKEYDYSTCSPKQFVGFIANADIVITNSFHGTAFSVILGVEFYTIKNSKDGLDNTRLEMLLREFELTNRYISGIDEISKDRIDYDNVNLLLNTARQNSINYLISTLGFN